MMKQQKHCNHSFIQACTGSSLRLTTYIKHEPFTLVNLRYHLKSGDLLSACSYVKEQADLSPYTAGQRRQSCPWTRPRVPAEPCHRDSEDGVPLDFMEPTGRETLITNGTEM